jgi:acyl-CoA dehydrogenase
VNFGLSEEQEMIVKTVRDFVETEIYPHENEVERTGIVPPEIGDEIRRKCIELGFYACNFPEEIGGAGLDHVTFTLVERELGRGSMGLTVFFGRPSGILMACEGEQKERYLLPAVRGEKIDALAITEPDAGSDMRGMKCAARQDGGDFVLNGTKHFISHADVADFVIVFAATGEEETHKGVKKKITAFLVDRGTPGFDILKGYDSVSHRGYHNSILNFTDCRLPKSQVLGEVHRGFDLANQWLYGTRLTVAATCVDLLTLSAAWKLDAGIPANREIASAKLYASEMLARVTDEAIQIFGGMGLMDDLPLARFWRDARVERIWDGTSEIQRHIISRDLLRPFGA